MVGSIRPRVYSTSRCRCPDPIWPNYLGSCVRGLYLGHIGGSTLVTRGGLGFVRENGIDGDNRGCFRKIRRDDVLVATPRDYASCHEM